MSESITTRNSRDGKNCTYLVRIFYRQDGQRQSVSKSFCSKDYGSKKIAKEEAIKWRDKMRTETDDLKVINTKYTVDDVFKLHVRADITAKSTEDKHRCYYNNYVVPYAPKTMSFKDVTYLAIQESLNAMVDTCTDDTIKHVLTVWKALYRTAIKNDIVERDLTFKVTKPVSKYVIAKRDMTTSKEKVDDAIKTLRKLNHENFELIADAIVILYHTGMRPAECFALEQDCIDKEKHLITVRQSLTETKEGWVISRTKTKKSIRQIPYSEELDEVFARLNNNPLFQRKDGAMMDSDYVGNILYKYCKGFRLYQNRHQLITDMIKNGVPLGAVQAFAGHEDASTTLSYVRTNIEDLREALKKR